MGDSGKVNYRRLKQAASDHTTCQLQKTRARRGPSAQADGGMRGRFMADGVRFELTEALTLRWFSRPVPSTTRPPIPVIYPYTLYVFLARNNLFFTNAFWILWY